jgi:hypothetical protein
VFIELLPGNALIESITISYEAYLNFSRLVVKQNFWYWAKEYLMQLHEQQFEFFHASAHQTLPVGTHNKVKKCQCGLSALSTSQHRIF